MAQITLTNDIIEVKENRVDIDNLIFSNGKPVLAIDVNKINYGGKCNTTTPMTVMVDKIVCYG